MASLDSLCLLGNISVGATVYLIGSGLNPAVNYGAKDQVGYRASGKPDADGYWLPFVYTSALAGTDTWTLWDIDATPDVQVTGPWTVTWIPPNPGPPVTPGIPFPAYCPTPEVTLYQGDDWNRLDWYPAIVCDVARNDGMFYDVLRGTAPSGPFTAIATNLTEFTYTDLTPVSGVTYYYRVRAHTTYLGGRIPHEATSPTVATIGLLESWGAVAQ